MSLKPISNLNDKMLLALNLNNYKLSELVKIKNIGNNYEIEKSILLENKFIGIDWDIVIEKETRDSKEINVLKIHINILYLNLKDNKKKSLNIVIDENKFEEMLKDFNKIIKYFK